MTDFEKKLVLKSMGYREADEDPEVWLKPIATSLCLFSLKTNVFKEYYHTADTGKVAVMTSKEFAQDLTQEQFLWEVITMEYAVHAVWHGNVKGFAFISPVEIAELHDIT